VEIGILLVFVYSLICSTIFSAEFEVLLIKNTSIVRDLDLAWISCLQ
jgi:hypothetical protein